MAEIVGLSASLITLIQVVGKATSIGYGYLGAVKRAPDELQGLVNELNSLSLVLASLQNYVNTYPQSEALQKLNDPSPAKPGPLQECARELAKLVSKAEPKTGWRKILGRLKWPLQETETSQIIAQIERHKSLFNLALGTDHM